MIAFTLCSNNYLAQAKTLGDSLIYHNPGYKFVIGLVDEESADIDYLFSPHQIIPVKKIGIPDFDEIWRKYDIVELNTCVKASFFKYLKKQFQDASIIFYFDPDIMILHSLKQLEQEFNDSDILLTPHILTPIPVDDKSPAEYSFLNFGIYNLGFLGLKIQVDNVNIFLDWWEERTMKLGYNDTCKGLFVDQLWINLVPVFFENVKVLRSFGYNAAPWNLYERSEIRSNQGIYTMKDDSILTFYHFSSFNFQTPEKLSIYNRSGFTDCPDLKPLYHYYLKQVLNNRIEQLSKVQCYYVEMRKQYIQGIKQSENGLKSKSKIKHILKAILPPFLIKLARFRYTIR